MPPPPQFQMNRFLVGVCPEAVAYVERPRAATLELYEGKKQCDSYFRQGRRGEAVRDVMLGSRFSVAEKSSASACAGV